MKIKVILTVLFVIAVVVSVDAFDDGRRCEKCGKMTMYGGSHFCKPRSGGRIPGGYGRQEKYIPQKKVEKNPVELRPNTMFMIKKGMAEEIRKWRDMKGNILEGSLSYISEVGDKVWIKKKNGNHICVVTAKLAMSDRDYISKMVNGCKDAGLIWHLGVYMTAEKAREYDYVNEAKDAIRLKDELAQRIDGMRILSARNDGGYAMPLVKDSAGDYVPWQEMKDDVYYYSQNENRIADGDTLKGVRMYWAGTFEYDLVTTYRNYWGEQCRHSKGKTTNAYSDDLGVAIYQVRKCLKLYDSGDPKFESKSAHEGTNIVGRDQGDKAVPVLRATGSGFAVTKSGYIVTNQHVIDNAKKIEVVTKDGVMDANVIQQDADVDLALLKIDGAKHTLKFSPNRIEKLGTEVFTVGFPMTQLQGYQPKVNKGVISGTEGFMGTANNYQIDAAIQPGNSGGPLCDVKGRLVGVIVATLKRGQNVNFAIKKSYLNAFLDSIPDCSKDIEDSSADENSSVDFANVVEMVTPACVLVRNYQ